MYVQGGLGVLWAIVGLLPIVLGAVAGYAQAVLPLVIGAITFVFTVFLAALSFVLASMVRTRRPGVRTAILVLESIIAALQVLNVLAVSVLVAAGGNFRAVIQALSGLAIALAILIPMAREEARAWFLSAA